MRTMNFHNLILIWLFYSRRKTKGSTILFYTELILFKSLYSCLSTANNRYKELSLCMAESVYAGIDPSTSLIWPVNGRFPLWSGHVTASKCGQVWLILNCNYGSLKTSRPDNLWLCNSESNLVDTSLGTVIGGRKLWESSQSKFKLIK